MERGREGGREGGVWEVWRRRWSNNKKPILRIWGKTNLQNQPSWKSQIGPTSNPRNASCGNQPNEESKKSKPTKIFTMENVKSTEREIQEKQAKEINGTEDPSKASLRNQPNAKSWTSKPAKSKERGPQDKQTSQGKSLNGESGKSKPSKWTEREIWKQQIKDINRKRNPEPTEREIPDKQTEEINRTGNPRKAHVFVCIFGAFVWMLFVCVCVLLVCPFSFVCARACLCACEDFLQPVASQTAPHNPSVAT